MNLWDFTEIQHVLLKSPYLARGWQNMTLTMTSKVRHTNLRLQEPGSCFTAVSFHPVISVWRTEQQRPAGDAGDSR